MFLRSLAVGAVGGPALLRVEAAHAALARAEETLAFRAADPTSVARLRAEYLLASDVLYLNHASIGTVPRAVHEAHASYLALCETNPSLYVWGAPWRDAAEAIRTAAARLLGADADDLAVTHNTTEGFNVLAHGMPLGSGDEVLFSSLNHPGASVPWERMAVRRGFTVRSFEFPIGRAADVGPEEVVALHSAALSPATRVLVVPHVDNQIGLRHPLPELARAARAAGVEWVVVDGAQSAGMIPVDLAASGVDAYAMSPHKWLQAPKGLGLFWTSVDLRAVVPPMWHRTGGEGRGPTARQYEDYSTRAWPAVAALGDALDFQAAVGESEKERRHRAVRARLRARVDATPGLLWRSPDRWEDGSAIVAVEVRGRDARDVAADLERTHGLGVRAFGPPLNALRLSPNVATTDDEVGRALDALEDASRA